MLRSSFLALSLTTLLAGAAGCGGKTTAPTTAPDDDLDTEPSGDGTGESDAETAPEPEAPKPEPRDQAVEEGKSWKRVEPGTWELTPFASDKSSRSLSAEAGGRGIVLVELPKGATGGTLSKVTAHYTGAGTARWVIYPAAGKPGDIKGDVLGQTEIVIAEDQVNKPGGEAIWTDAPFDPPLAIDVTKFHLAFEVVDGKPAVAADNDKTSPVYYQGPKDKKPKKTPLSAHVKVVLTDVH